MEPGATAAGTADRIRSAFAPASPRRMARAPGVLLLRQLPRVSTPLTVAVAVGLALSAVLPTAFTVASGVLVGGIPPAVEAGFDSDAGRRLLVALAVVAGLFIVQLGVLPFASLANAMLARRIDRDISQRVLGAMGAPPTVTHLEDPETHDDVAKAEGLIGHFTPGGAFTGLVSLWTVRLQGVGALVILTGFRWWLGPAIAINEILERRWWRRRYTEVTTSIFDRGQIHRRSGWFREAVLTPEAAKELRAFGLSGWMGWRFRTAWSDAMAPVWSVIRGSGWSAAGAMILPTVGVAAALAYVGSEAMTGAVSLTALVIVARSILQAGGLGAVGDWDEMVAAGVATVPVALELERRLQAEAPAGGRSARDLPRQSITFDNVWFRYPGRDHDVYRGLDLEIEAGKSLAIVGENGAGKTTLVKLLAGLHVPAHGRIAVDSVDLGYLDMRQWQPRVAAIFQDFERYELLARHNVGYGAPALVDDDDALDRVARRAGALDVVDSLPQGWETPLSRRLTGGVELSGGQWQRIAIARALMAVEGGAGVLVLDEPTANLDVRTEAEIYERFLDLTRGLTTIVISHRFSTVRRADRIVVLEAGRVVEDGSHDELVAARGRYAHMFTLQASRYWDDDGQGAQGAQGARGSWGDDGPGSEEATTNA